MSANRHCHHLPAALQTPTIRVSISFEQVLGVIGIRAGYSNPAWISFIATDDQCGIRSPLRGGSDVGVSCANLPGTSREMSRLGPVLSPISAGTSRPGSYKEPDVSRQATVPLCIPRLACSPRIRLRFGQPNQCSARRFDAHADQVQDLRTLDGAIEPLFAGVLLFVGPVCVCNAGFIEFGSHRL